MAKPLSKLALQHPLIILEKDKEQATNKLPGQPLATGCNSGIWNGQHVHRLKTDWPKLLLHLTCLGFTLFITSHGDTTHETLLPMYKLALSSHTASIADSHGSLEIDLSHWHCGFALYTGGNPEQTCISLHFFDINGKLMHSIYPTLSLSELGNDFLHNMFVTEQQHEDFLPLPNRSYHPTKHDIDQVSLIGHWRLLKSCHSIPIILQKHGVSRLEALRILNPEFTTPLKPTALAELLQEVANNNMEIRLALHNPGVIQNHFGLIEKFNDNVLSCRSNDAYFRMEINDADIHNVWVVHKPVAEGMVSSLEIYNRQGELLLMLSDTPRKHSQQSFAWHELLQALSKRFPA